MATDPVGPFPLQGITLETWQVKFDKLGQCTSPLTRDALLERCKNESRPVILFSHGWNNEFGDAVGLYTRFLTHLQSQIAAQPAPFDLPIFVGVVWPSTWLSFDKGPDMAGDAPEVGAAPLEAELTQELSAQLSPGPKRERLNELAARKRLNGPEGVELAALVAEALGQEIQGATSDGDEGTVPQAVDLLSGAAGLEQAMPSTRSVDELDAPGTIDGSSSGHAANDVASAGVLEFLDPRKLLRVASVYQMKDRAGTVGANGVSDLLAGLLQRAPAVHAVGHSYGGKVVLSAIAALPDGVPKVASVLLLQPAVSHWCFAQEGPDGKGQGGYRHVRSRVSRSIISTYSKFDFPLHSLFHRAVRRAADDGDIRIASGAKTQAGAPPNRFAALGGYGPRLSDEKLHEPLPAPGTAIDLGPAAADGGPARLLAYDGSMNKLIGGHGDVTTPHTAWLLYSQMAATGY
ncbi:hypothetical protein J7E70_31820 [Variovorax paradoxus]|nr:hypothetical protein [Variovorax paradoxus]MBT2305006.1 hypothetical protein [Variovorax paradoxus]